MRLFVHLVGRLRRFLLSHARIVLFIVAIVSRSSAPLVRCVAASVVVTAVVAAAAAVDVAAVEMVVAMAVVEVVVEIGAIEIITGIAGKTWE